MKQKKCLNPFSNKVFFFKYAVTIKIKNKGYKA